MARLANLDTHELAWAAGFFDGEGTTTQLTNRSGLQVAVGQAEPGPLLRFQRAVRGLGRVRGPYQRPLHLRDRQRPFWHWKASSFEETQAVIAMLWPWLGETKRAQATARFLVRRERLALSRQTHCLHGHSLADAYVSRSGWRNCRPCKIAATRAYRARLRGAE